MGRNLVLIIDGYFNNYTWSDIDLKLCFLAEMMFYLVSYSDRPMVSIILLTDSNSDGNHNY